MELNTTEIKVSVRTLVEFIMQFGDISPANCGTVRMTEGIKVHKAMQKQYAAKQTSYTSEVPISLIIEKDNITIEISGRIDGVIESGDSVIIEEIKTVTCTLDDIHKDQNPMYWPQAKCYAYMYGVKNNIKNIAVQLTYYRHDNSETKVFTEYYDIQYLKLFFEHMVFEYLEWIEMNTHWIALRNQSIKELKFPFNVYRKGQREFAVAVYKSVKDGRLLFAQAPTGIGKTIAALFPAIKALGEGHTSKIFYLTAKTIARTVAEKAFDNMRCSGLALKTVTITAKDKICLNPHLPSCDPEFCEYARGYYDRIKTALKDAFRVDSFTRQLIEDLAVKHCVCPFEFSLDLSLLADCIICDYNYVFDPKVYFKRYFEDKKGHYCFLIDEAHNLVDRAREMFSAELLKSMFLKLKRSTKLIYPDIYKTLKSINNIFIAKRKLCKENEKDFYISEESPCDLYTPLKKFTEMVERFLLHDQNASLRDELIDAYFKVVDFLRVYQFFDNRYVTYIEQMENDLRIKLFCLDTSYLLSEALKKGKAAVFFSATLTPLDYFVRLLGGDEDSLKIRLASPFCRENLCLIVEDKISTRYRMREFSYRSISQLISDVTCGKTGNYIIFFPSYKYLNEVYESFYYMNTGARLICQKRIMSEAERDEFLNEFSTYGEQTLIGFAVMGGIFGEGIDLVGDRLSGVLIVGVGLPQICLERDIIRGYFDSLCRYGYEYAYMYPGINRVLQAAGRVIRTDKDRGVVLLIDDRFATDAYKDLYPPEWSHLQKVRELKSLKSTIKEFWENPL